MNEPPNDLRKRLLFIMYRGWTEARELALSDRREQMHDLADALHPIPAYMTRWEPKNLEAIRDNLEAYCQKYPESAKRSQYVQFLAEWEIPEF